MRFIDIPFRVVAFVRRDSHPQFGTSFIYRCRALRQGPDFCAGAHGVFGWRERKKVGEIITIPVTKGYCVR